MNSRWHRLPPSVFTSELFYTISFWGLLSRMSWRECWFPQVCGKMPHGRLENELSLLQLEGSSASMDWSPFPLPRTCLTSWFPYAHNSPRKLPKVQCQVQILDSSGSTVFQVPPNQVLHRLCIRGKLSDKIHKRRQKASAKASMD